MTHPGYHWTIRADGEGWRWGLLDADGGMVLVEGKAPSRPVAAALVIRAMARGMTTEMLAPETLAA